MLKALPSLVYVCNNEGIVTFLNEEAMEFLDRGVDLDKDNLQDLLKIYNSDGTAMSLETATMGIANNIALAIKGDNIILENPKGKRMYVSSSTKSLFNSNGDIIGIIHMFTKLPNVLNGLSQVANKQSPISQLNAFQYSEWNPYKNERWYHKMVEEVEDYAILLLDVNGNVQN